MGLEGKETGLMRPPEGLGGQVSLCALAVYVEASINLTMTCSMCRMHSVKHIAEI